VELNPWSHSDLKFDIVSNDALGLSPLKRGTWERDCWVRVTRDVVLSPKRWVKKCAMIFVKRLK